MPSEQPERPPALLRLPPRRPSATSTGIGPNGSSIVRSVRPIRACRVRQFASAYVWSSTRRKASPAIGAVDNAKKRSPIGVRPFTSIRRGPTGTITVRAAAQNPNLARPNGRARASTGQREPRRTASSAAALVNSKRIACPAAHRNASGPVCMPTQITPARRKFPATPSPASGDPRRIVRSTQAVAKQSGPTNV